MNIKLNLFEIINIKTYDININQLIYKYVDYIIEGDLYNECICILIRNDKKNINLLTSKNMLTLSKLEQMINKIGWNIISVSGTISELFMEKYIHKIDINGIIECQKISEQFIEKIIDMNMSEIDFETIFSHQKLSEPLIEKIIHKYQDVYSYDECWNNIFEFQNISEQFVKKYIHKISNIHITNNIYLSKEFICEILLILNNLNRL